MNATYRALIFTTRKIFYLEGKEFETMREFCKQFPVKVGFLISLLNLFVISALGQNEPTLKCKEKDYECRISNYAIIVVSKCKAKGYGYDCLIAEQTKIVDSNPSDIAAYLYRGRTYHTKEPNRAILDFNKVLELDPTYKEAYVLLGIIYSSKGEYHQAINELNKLIKLDPKYSNAYVNRGFVYSQQRDFDKALADYNKTIELSPGNSTAYNNRAAVYSSQGHFDKALADYNKAVEVSPDEWSLYYSRSGFYWKLGEKAKAVADLQMAKQLADPEEWQRLVVKKLKPEVAEELKKLDASLLSSSAEESAQIEAYQRFGLGAFLFSCKDNNYTVVTTYKDFVDTPSWNPEKEENAPLSIRRALEIARTTLNQCYPKANNNWIPLSIKLKPVGNNKWVYFAKLECPSQSCANNQTVNLYIKLDGTVILPKALQMKELFFELNNPVAQPMKKLYSNTTSTFMGVRVAYLFSCNGNNYTVEFSDRDFINTPSWNPEKEDNPPLSIRRALEIARATLNRCHPNVNNNWSLRYIQLNQTREDKWVYDIEFYSPGNVRINTTLYVKLDGTVILPKPDDKPTEKLEPSFGIPSGVP